MNALRSRWNTLTRREKRIATCAAGLVAIVLLYLIVWAPMRNATARLEQELPRMQRQAAQMRSYTESLTLRTKEAGETSPLAPGLPDVRALAARAQIPPLAVQMEPTEHNATRLRFESVSGDALIALLELAHRERRWRVVDMQLARLTDAGRVRAEVTLTSARP